MDWTQVSHIAGRRFNLFNLLGFNQEAQERLPWPGNEPGPRQWERRILVVFHKKQWNNAICSNMDGPTDYDTKWSKSEKEKWMSYDNTCGI